jgi:tRNA uridine 5-carboxymethylaminomethyl modification enzyme
LERVKMTRPGYAIEYDYFPPTQLDSTLGVKAIRGLFFAGQINGTTGYEEAAGQGVVAGLNAAAAALDRDPVVFRRDQAMIGVLVDDLVSRGVDEPYRLFTSRAEFRLLLRQDNALHRLYPLAERLGILSDGERIVAEERLAKETSYLDAARATTIPASAANVVMGAAGSAPVNQGHRIAELAKRPGVELSALFDVAGVEYQAEEIGWAAIELRYGGYLERERLSAERLLEMETFEVPSDIPYQELNGLTMEAREKLSQIRPRTLGHAARVPGVNPSDIQSLVFEVLKRRKRVEPSA